MDEFGERVAGFLGKLYVFSDVTPFVISHDGWSWIVAWAQLGVQRIVCRALTPLASRQLAVVQECLGPSVDFQVVESGREALEKQPQVLSFHLDTSDEAAILWSEVLEVRMDIPKLYSFAEPCGHDTFDLSSLGSQYTTLRHRRLGGLTTAHVGVGWSPPNRSVLPGTRVHPTRPIGAFLEPSSKLDQWRLVGEAEALGDDVWDAVSPSALPFPWPSRHATPWVRTRSVFFKDRLLERPMTVKEKSQILDVREDWGASILDYIWEWNDRGSPPLRCLVEFVLSAAEILGRESDGTGPDNPETETIEVIDWGRQRYPFEEVVDELGAPCSVLDQRVYRGWFWDPLDSVEVSVATKADDAEVDLSLWNVGGDGPGMEEARTVLREDWLWQVWLRRLRREGIAWLRGGASTWSDDEMERNQEGVRDCIVRCGGSTWWKWDDGSRLYFWRWPEVWRVEARDGARAWHVGELEPRFNFRSVPIDDPWAAAKVDEKLLQLLNRRYLEVGPVRRVLPFFWVWKTRIPPDVRVVWNAKQNGVNAIVRAPSFQLPTPSSVHRILEAYMHCGDFDVGEQFPNYMLHPTERRYFGVRLSKSLMEQLRKDYPDLPDLWRWERLPFGWMPSPYLALSMLARVLELVQRAPSDRTSAFCWELVELNLPGMEGYDPSLPRVRRLRFDGLVAVVLKSYFDDGRVAGPNEDLTRRGLRQVTSGIQYYGNQDASRKRREVSMRAGAWAGSVSYTDQGVPRKLITQKKWTKTQDFLDWVDEHLEAEREMERKAFKSGTGFLLHVGETYQAEVQPYLQGFFLSENSWRDDRDAEGYQHQGSAEPPPVEEDKLFEEGLLDDVEESHAFDDDWERPTSDPEASTTDEAEDGEPPPMVSPVPRLADDVRALKMVFAGDTPVHSIIRPVRGAFCVVYGGGDAAGEGFGSKWNPLGMETLAETGFWCSEASEQTSNWREFRNLLEAIRREAARGRLTGKEVWVATDNSTASISAYKGRSGSPLLDKMVLELRLIGMRANCIIRFVHVAGTRMIAFGIDGLSRGEFQVGALLRQGPRGILPLHLSALDRSPDLACWARSWGGEDLRFAEPADWFYNAQQGGDYGLPQRDETWVWAPPPAAALDALEELGFGRLKRRATLRGIVLVPTMMEEEWFRRFAKNVDLRFLVPAGSIPEWPACQYESLTVGVYLPLLHYRPWDWKDCCFMVSLGRSLSAMFRSGDPSGGRVLCEFWASSRWIAAMPERLVCDVLSHPSWRRFLNISRNRR